MKWRSWLKRGTTQIVPLVPLILLLATLLAPAAAQAAGGIALSGSFYQQAFEIPQGSSASGPDVYVVVFNNGSGELKVRMSSQAPTGVTITLSRNEFTLPPKGQQQVMVRVDVAKDADPGEYEISVTAESYKENLSGGGIQLVGAAGQNAKLIVVGESSQITVQAASPDGQPILATVRLYRVINASGDRREVAYSETGKLEVKVAPGNFVAVSYIGGEKVSEQSLTVANKDQKSITLSGATVYFEGFGVVPNSYDEGGKLAFAQIVYTVRNLYQPVDKGEVVLQVTRDNAPLQDVNLVTLSPLGLGQTELNYNYIPSSGWKDGNYGFKLLLNLDGKLYTTSKVEQLQVSGGAESTAPSTPTATNIPAATGNTPPASGTSEGGGGGSFPLIIGAIVAVIVIAAGAWWLFVRRKKVA